MIDRIGRAVAVTAGAGLLVGLAAVPALAHERRAQGDLEIVVGFGTEPAYAGVPNSVQVVLVHDGEPVTDLGNTLDVEVAFGDRTQPFELEPFFGPGFGTPGDYRAWFIPTDAGSYSSTSMARWTARRSTRRSRRGTTRSATWSTRR
jgi:hypothetical protein